MDRNEQKVKLAQLIRQRSASQIVDVSGTAPGEVAIYTLSDPRDVRVVRYVGQTSSPRRRFLQHLSSARLWLPEEMPWWIKRPEMRSLYRWIKELYLDEYRLPMMMVTHWTPAADALARERDIIFEHLQRQTPLFNRESDPARNQLRLI